MAIQIGIDIEQFGAADMIIGLLGLAILRELGAVITGIILAGRAGAAITAGLAAMHITEEISALRTFGSSPTLRLVLPRVIGMGISVPLLVLWTEVWAMIGGSFSAQSTLGVSQRLFFARLPDAVPSVNFWIGLGKGALFGLTIALVSSYFGLKSKPSTESLSKHTTTSVVTSLSLIILIDAVAGAAMTGIGIGGGA
jgi:phospholipid/cholesterol/gamma-HCH transport system permease protein